MNNTTPLIERARRDEQEALARRHNGEAPRLYRSDWVVDRLRNRISPVHYAIASALVALQATAEGLQATGGAKVDCANGVEIGLAARIDAAAEIDRYRQAVRARVNGMASVCLSGIAEVDTFEALRRRLGLPRGSGRVVPMVQLTLIAAQEYEDECAKQRVGWGKNISALGIGA